MSRTDPANLRPHMRITHEQMRHIRNAQARIVAQSENGRPAQVAWGDLTAPDGGVGGALDDVLEREALLRRQLPGWACRHARDGDALHRVYGQRALFDQPVCESGEGHLHAGEGGRRVSQGTLGSPQGRHLALLFRPRERLFLGLLGIEVGLQRGARHVSRVELVAASLPGQPARKIQQDARVGIQCLRIFGGQDVRQVCLHPVVAPLIGHVDDGRGSL